jgi:hypothetical protein
MKMTLGQFNKILETTEGRYSELKDKLIQIIQCEEQKDEKYLYFS